LIVGAADQIRTAEPTQLKTDAMRADSAGFDGVGQVVQSLRSETAEEVSPASAVERHERE
jgi:hypothetical protein